MSGGGLALDRLCKIYRSHGKGPVLAVDKVDLAAGPGEIVGLLGSSGCGKTSTLQNDRRLRGRERGAPISLGGDRLNSIKAACKDRGVAMAFEGYRHSTRRSPFATISASRCCASGGRATR